MRSSASEGAIGTRLVWPSPVRPSYQNEYETLVDLARAASPREVRTPRSVALAETEPDQVANSQAEARPSATASRGAKSVPPPERASAAAGSLNRGVSGMPVGSAKLAPSGSA